MKKTTISLRWETFLKALADSIAEPTPYQPTVRCWTRTSLIKLFKEIKEQSSLPSTFPDSPEIIKHLINIGWAHPINVDVIQTGASRSKEFYLLDIGAAHGANVDPLELLQAYRPDGVICYFSALAYHSLTTQFATHHHIAVINKPSRAQTSVYQFPPAEKIDGPLISNRKLTLGEQLFNYQGIPCYLIKRSSSLIIGVQTRILGPRTNLRITTLEQTLLDTFNKPRYCGGASVIFEAWEDGIARLDEDILNNYLLKINSPPILRRVGTMFDLLNFEPDRELKSTIEKSLESSGHSPLTSIPLLPGFESNALNTKWQVKTP
jgi:predicted transcriptional regulator of viral defense system